MVGRRETAGDEIKIRNKAQIVPVGAGAAWPMGEDPWAAQMDGSPLPP